MTSAELLADAFNRIQETVHEAVRGLTSSQLGARLDPDANSIAWLCWHLTRVQDDHVAGAFGVTAGMDRVRQAVRAALSAVRHRLRT